MLEAGGGGLVEEATSSLPGKQVGMEEMVDDNKRLQVKIEECGLEVALLINTVAECLYLLFSNEGEFSFVDMSNCKIL